MLVLPLSTGVVHVLHNVQRKRLGGRVGVTFAGHILAALIQARVAQTDGGIAAVEQLVDGLTLLQAGQRTNAKTEIMRLFIEGDMTAKDAK